MKCEVFFNCAGSCLILHSERIVTLQRNRVILKFKSTLFFFFKPKYCKWYDYHSIQHRSTYIMKCCTAWLTPAHATVLYLSLDFVTRSNSGQTNLLGVAIQPYQADLSVVHTTHKTAAVVPVTEPKSSTVHYPLLISLTFPTTDSMFVQGNVHAMGIIPLLPNMYFF